MEANNKQNPALPLYKRLNEKRQQGTFEAVQFDSPHKDICIKLSDCKVNGHWHFADRVCENMPDIETAKYTALAVNNLHILADALTDAKQFIVDNMHRLPDSHDIRLKILKALNNIS